MNLDEARKRIPELAGLSDQSALNVIHEVYYPQIDKAQLAERLGYKPPAPPMPERSAMRAVGDVGLSLTQGAAGAFRALSDLGGADNAVSQGLRGMGDYMQDLKSEQSQATMQASQQRIKEAEATGSTVEEVKAYMGMIFAQPVEMLAQAAGSFATLGLGKAAQAMKLASAAKAAGVTKAAFLANPANQQAIKAIAEVGFRTNIGVGVGMGVGAVKGSQYEQTYQNALQQDMGEDQARALAEEAQRYGGEGTMQQVLGGGLGALAASTGPIERMVVGTGARTGTRTGAALKGGGTEFATEGAQGAQERFAGNDAAVDAGVLAPENRMRGVVGQGFQEGTLGGALGAGIGAISGPEPVGAGTQGTGGTQGTPPAPLSGTLPPPAPPAPPPAPPPAGPLTRAANAGGLGARLTQTPMADLLGGAVDPLAAQITADRQAQEDEEMAVGGLMGDGGADVSADPQELNALRASAQNQLDFAASLGIDVDGLRESAAMATQDGTESDYLDTLASLTAKAIAGASNAPAAPADAPAAPAPDWQPGDILNPSDAPFKTKMAAERAAKQTPGEVVPVAEGFVIRPAATTQEPANDQATPAANAGSGSEVPPAATAAQGALNEPDSMLGQVRDIVLKDRNASIAYVQGKLKIGYNRAARLIEDLEREKVVGPMNASGKREVLGKAEPTGAPNVQNAPPPATQAQAPASEAPAPASSDAAPAGGVPAAPGAGDVQADGVKPPPAAPLTRARTIEPGPAVVLQNRDRSSAASVAQMNEIAAQPDYLRAGPARVMDSGAPVVFGDAPETALMGREEPVADGRGQRTQTQYMVVEASDLLASNRADGTRVPEYEQGQPGKLRAVAGNGRAAGITEAYSRGTAGQYKADLVADAQALGMEPAAIEAMSSPVLVRVMSGNDVTPDMGDRSNIAGTARLSASEQANTDARRVDLSALAFDDQGNPTADSVRQFTGGMPTSERSELLNPDGTATRQAIDRLMAATFKQAYGSDDLVQLYAQATDPDARTVMTALADAASAMAGLSNTGDLDIRSAVAEAAGMAVNARRRGIALADMLQNADIETSGEAFVIARFFADNIRSAKKMAEGLRNWANYAAEQAQIARGNETQDGLFGAAPVASRGDVFQRIEDGQVPKTDARQPARQDPATDGAQRAPDEPDAGQAGAATGDAEAAQAEGLNGAEASAKNSESLRSAIAAAYKVANGFFGRDIISAQIQNDWQRLLDAADGRDAAKLKALEEKYRKDEELDGMGAGTSGAGPGKVRQSRRGAGQIPRFAREIRKLIESEQAADPLLNAPAPATPAWDSLTEENKKQTLLRAGWRTNKGDLNVIGKNLMKRPWADIAEGTRARLEKAMVEPVAAVSATAQSEFRRGTIGQKLGTGEVVLDQFGNETTPFPKVSLDTNRKSQNTVRAVDQWLIQNALSAAQKRGDRFNERQFQAIDSRNITQSDKDSAEEYLFGDDAPAVAPSILKPLVPAPAPAPAPAAAQTKPITELTFDQWVQQKYDANEYKAAYLEAFGGNEKLATLGAAVSTTDSDRKPADLLKAARAKYFGDLMQQPREASLSLDVWDSLSDAMRIEAQRHFFDLDGRIVKRDQEQTRTRVDAESAKKAPYEAAFAEVDAEIRRLDQIPGPITKKQNELSARRERLRQAIFLIGQGKEPDGRLLKAEPAPAAPAPVPDTPQAEDDYLAALFGTPEEQAAQQASFEVGQQAQARDKGRVRDAIGTEQKRAQAEYDDWSSRVYKRNSNQVDLNGDGPSSQASMSVSGINESRRRNAMEALGKELSELKKMQTAVETDSGVERVLRNMRDLYAKADRIATDGMGLFKTADEQFQYMLLDDMKFRGPAGKGNVTSNGLSKAMLAAIKPTAPAADAEPLLTAPTEQEILARQDTAEAADRQAKANQRAADAVEKKRQDRADIAMRSESAAGAFELGQDPLQSLMGQESIFGDAAPAPTRAPRSAGQAYEGYDSLDKEKTPRVQGGRVLKAALNDRAEGKLSEGAFALRLNLLAARLTEATKAKAENAVDRERARGADLVREKLLAARRRGDLDPDMVEFALWALNKNPNLAEELGLSIKSPGEDTPAGRYNPADRVMTLFKDGQNEGTAVHEILHHSERMMPADVQAGIASQWAKAFAAAVKKASPEQALLLGKMLEAMAGSAAARAEVTRAFTDRKLDYDTHYELVNPSEYWAVNGTRIMRSRFDGAASWVGRAKQWLTEMIQTVKGLLGLSSDAPILRGLDAVLRGDGSFQSKRMLSQASSFDDLVATRVTPTKDVRNLVAMHNLTAENLIYADRMGGIPVPSIGITKVDTPFIGFGGITMIAPASMVDPADGVPVFDRDAWTARFPTLNFKKPKRAKSDAFYERMKAMVADLVVDEGSFLSSLWESMVNTNMTSPDKVARHFQSYDAPRLAYARDVLKRPVKVPMKDVEPSEFFGREKVWLDFVKRTDLSRENLAYDDPARAALMKEAGDAALAAADAYIDKKVAGQAASPEAAAALRKMFAKMRNDLVSDNGAIRTATLDRARRDAETVGTKRADGIKLREALEKVVKSNDPAYLKWVQSQVAPLFDDATMTLRGKEVEPTLENIVDAMTVGALQGAEKSLTFGAGKTAAMLGKRFKSMSEIKADRDRVVSQAQENEGKKATEALLEEYRLRVADFFTQKDWRGNIDTWAANDASMEGLAKAGKAGGSDASIRSALSRAGFQAVDAKTVDLAKQSIDALRNAATDYFEAKPQRAVMLNEFRGAVIPKGTSQEIKDILTKNGVEFVEFNSKNEGAREAAIQKMTARVDKPAKDVVFSRSTGQQTPSISQSLATQIVDSIKARWANAPEIVVVSNMQDAAVPKAVRDEDAKQRSQGASGEPEGFFYGGKVYVVAGSLNSPGDVVRVLMHESLGHFGLRGVFGDSLAPILNQIATMRRADVIARARQYGLVMTDANGDPLVDVKTATDAEVWAAMNADLKNQAAEEVLAFMAQTRPELGFVKRAIAAIRAFLRKNVPGFQQMRLTDADIIANYILPARAFVERGRMGRAGSMAAPAFNRTQPVTKDEQGMPVIVGDEGVTLQYAAPTERLEFIPTSDAQQMFAFQISTPSNPFAGFVDVLFEDGVPVELYDIEIDPAERGSKAATRAVKALLDATPNGKLAISNIVTEAQGFWATLGIPTQPGLEQGRAYDGTITRETYAASPAAKNAGRANRVEAENNGEGQDQTRPDAEQGSATQDLSDEDAQKFFPDTRFSRTSPAGIQQAMMDAIPQGVVDRLSDMTTSQRGFNRWWHRTVGTQLHKAKTNEQFRPVYYAVQDFMKDVSRMATLAADQAPDLLPQVDNLTDVKKLLPHLVSTKKRKAQIKEASDALFDGTLRYTRDEDGNPMLATADGEKGLVWTDAELRARGMGDESIAMYRQSRAAIEQSLDNLLASDVYRMLTGLQPELLAKTPAEHLALLEKIRRGAASDSPQAAVKQAQDALQAQLQAQKQKIATLKTALRAESGRAAENIKEGLEKASDLANQITSAAKALSGKVERIAELKAEGYAPLMRFGPYTVDVTDDAGTRIHFGMYETQMAANQAGRKFASEGLTVRQGVQSQRDFELLKGVSPETAMLFADMLGVEKNDAMQSWLKSAMAQQSALKRHIRRKGVEGFENDASRVVAAFITSNSRAASRALHGLRIQERVANVRDGDVKDEAIALADYVNNPKEEAQAIRSLLFVYYIGGSIASAAVNLTQTLVQTFPYLAQFGGPAKGAARIGRAMKLAVGNIADADLAAAVQRAEEDGVIKPQEVFQLQAEASRTMGSDLRVRAALSLWGSFFQAAEVFNRRVAFIAAYQTAKEQGIADPRVFAENAVDETQGVFNKGNRPNYSRGAVGATLFVFKTFTIQYVEFLKRLPPKEKALALAVLILLSGMRGLPFAEDAEDIVDTVAQQLGYNFTTKAEMDKFLVSTLGKDFANFIQHGASGTGMLPVDLSARLGMANLLPATGLLKPSETRKEDQVLEVFGVAGSFVRDATKGQMTPIAIRNLAKGIEMYDRGIYTDTRGRKVMDVTPTDAAFKAIGLQPSSVATESRAVRSQYEQRALFTKNKNDITEQIALGMFEDNRDKVLKARARLADWNEKNPEARIVLNSASIRRRVVEMRKDRTDRFLRSTPRELRAQANEALQ